MTSIDLNADLGEGAGFDSELLSLVSSASIACGGHAGSDSAMRETLQAAKVMGVRTGAHPGFADRENFGRCELDISADEIANQVVEQVIRIMDIGEATGQPISYLKLHGALYNLAARDEALAAHIFAAMKSRIGLLSIMALAGSAQISAALKLGLPVIREGFADRAYAPDGKLAPRSESGAVLHDPVQVQMQALRMVSAREIIATDGTIILSNVQSICLHGDNVAAVELAKSVRAGLEAAAIAVRADA